MIKHEHGTGFEVEHHLPDAAETQYTISKLLPIPKRLGPTGRARGKEGVGFLKMGVLLANKTGGVGRR